MENKYNLVVYPKAELDMDDIFNYIYSVLHNTSAAIKQIEDFESALNKVCSFPESCPLVENEYIANKSLRKLIVNNYIVFYIADKLKKEIQVVRVLYGMMNYADIL